MLFVLQHCCTAARQLRVTVFDRAVAAACWGSRPVLRGAKSSQLISSRMPRRPPPQRVRAPTYPSPPVCRPTSFPVCLPTRPRPPCTRRFWPARAQAPSGHQVMRHFITTQGIRRLRKRLCAHSSCSWRDLMYSRSSRRPTACRDVRSTLS